MTAWSDTGSPDWKNWEGWANGKGLDAEDLAALGVDLTESTEPESVEGAGAVPTTEQPEVVATTEDLGSRGNGNAQSNGSGNGKGSPIVRG